MRTFKVLASARSIGRGRRSSQQVSSRILQSKSPRWNSRQFTRALSANTQILSPNAFESQISTCTFQFDEEDDDGT